MACTAVCYSPGSEGGPDMGAAEEAEEAPVSFEPEQPIVFCACCVDALEEGVRENSSV